MAQTVDGVTTEYVLDVAGGLPEVIVATTGGASTRYVQVQGQVLAQQDSGAWTYILPDHLGSVRQLVGSDSQVDLAQSFDPFGVPFETSGSGTSEFGYTGEWWGSYIALLYLRARYYDPRIGRFLSKDPFHGFPARPQTQNPYSYVRNDSINLVDPVGLQGMQPWREGLIEEATTVPFFLGPFLANWLAQAVDNVVGARDLLETTRRTLQSGERPSSIRDLYATTQRNALEILVQNYTFEYCGQPLPMLELEAAHLSLIVLAYFPIVEGADSDKDVWQAYPVYLAEADRVDIEKGWDKAGHFLTAAMSAFEYRYSVERGLEESLTWHIAAAAYSSLGAAYWAAYEQQAVTGKLFEPDLWEPLPPEFEDFHDFQAYLTVALSMAFFEVVSSTGGEYWEAIKEGSTKPITHGVFDPGTSRDMTANLRGTKFGIQVYHNPSPSAIPFIEGDEGSTWEGRVR